MNADDAARLHVSDVLSYYVDGYEMSDAYRSKSWDGRATFFDFGSSTFPAGFVNSVATALRTKGYTVAIRRKSGPAPLGLGVTEAYAAVSPFEPDPRYDYQPETVRRLIKYGQTIAQIATGGGKSMIARTAVKAILRPTLFLTTRQVLMYQMKAGFEEAGFTVGVMGDGEWAPKRGVNVATVQTIMARLSNIDTAVQTRKLLSIFELAILEEAHEAGSNTYYEVLNAMPNAYYRLALTATPFMRQDGEANMRLMAIAGQVGIRVPEKMLIERGILAKPYFKYVKAPMPETLLKTSSWQKAYDLGIVQNERRNEIIIEEVCRAVRYGLPGMVLVQRKAHGELLKKLFKAKGVRVDFIFGEHDQDRRARALDKLKQGQLDVLIGSTILDVGVDVPAVGIVALAGGGKAEIALRQRIGRGLRAKKGMPNVCMVLDFEDGKNKHLIGHYKTRRQIIEATPGFVENILKPGQDFPYDALGFSHKV
ncbi:MAG: DEAD/DEAH box helicase [Rhodobacterales bacterium]|nr:DEAD/DEAH box helicase [Rhodobacterales bacterium]